jgi:formate-dependent nitrite reductase cytochrome c552 subunit
MDTAAAKSAITEWKSEFQALEATARKNVAAAAQAMNGTKDEALQAKLKEAQHNLEYAASDESGGFHNHKYLMALLTDANSKAQEILSARGQ